MNSVTLVLVGGFLGAGKTTLLALTARHLAATGKRVGLITNDQADDLVDTGLLQREGFTVREIAGGCFCCRFDELVTAAERLLAEHRPDVLLGEPVGSCTDLSATVLQPLKALYGDWFRVAPFSVLADPERLRQVLEPGLARPFPDNVNYIFRKQLEEADVIVINKADTLAAEALTALQDRVRTEFPQTTVLGLSAKTGAGMAEWFEYVSSEQPAGRRIAEVDYDRYADGEAVLGWLNATVALSARQPTDWLAFCRALLGAIRESCRAQSAEIAHVKALLTTPGGAVTLNLTSTSAEVSERGPAPASCEQASLVLNTRVHLGPEALRALVLAAIERAGSDRCTADVVHLQSLSPGRPTPVHRYRDVV